jgi:hypothetical protein
MLRRHPVLSLATFGYLAIVAWVTLGPQPIDDEGRGILMRIIRRVRVLEGFEWVTLANVEFAANILMFVPIGLMFVLLLGRRLWWLAIVFSIALTVGIETLQLFIDGRVSDPRDLVSNTIGAVAGVFGALIITWPKARSLRQAEVRRRNTLDRERIAA